MRTRSRVRQVVAKAVGILAAAAASEADDAASIQEEEIAADEDARTPDAPHDSEDGGGNISSSVRHDDDEPPPLVCRQGPGTALHPQSPREDGQLDSNVTPRVLNSSSTATDDDIEPERGLNYDEYEGVDANPYDDNIGFDDAPDVGEDEDDPEDPGLNPTDWRKTPMQVKDFRYVLCSSCCCLISTQSCAPFPALTLTSLTTIWRRNILMKLRK